ncbi:MAG: four helix bundle protein [Fluviicola sp.]|nr:four helix bundle protein [Fluviicola sp.]
MRDYKKYQVWTKAHKLALDVYALTKNFPKSEQYGITSQLRRASLSIPTNIVEGTGRNSEKEFAYFINIAAGSAAEVEYLLIFSKDYAYISENEHEKINAEVVSVRKMLNALYSKVKS